MPQLYVNIKKLIIVLCSFLYLMWFLSFSLLETLNKVSVSQDILVAEVKGMRQELEGLARRITSLSSRQQQQQLRDKQGDSGLLSWQSWSSVVVAVVLYSFIKWLTERFWS